MLSSRKSNKREEHVWEKEEAHLKHIFDHETQLKPVYKSSVGPYYEPREKHLKLRWARQVKWDGAKAKGICLSPSPPTLTVKRNLLMFGPSRTSNIHLCKLKWTELCPISLPSGANWEAIHMNVAWDTLLSAWQTTTAEWVWRSTWCWEVAPEFREETVVGCSSHFYTIHPQVIMWAWPETCKTQNPSRLSATHIW